MFAVAWPDGEEEPPTGDQRHYQRDQYPFSTAAKWPGHGKLAGLYAHLHIIQFFHYEFSYSVMTQIHCKFSLCQVDM